MDPDATLHELLQLAADVELMTGTNYTGPDLTRAHAARMAELIHALDGWLNTGGYPPTRYTQ